jgi:hypothetical protein
MLAGYPVKCEPATGSKEVRAEPFASQCEAGNVRLVRGPWNAAYIDELTTFPNGSHDDQVDASSSAFNRLPHVTHSTSFGPQLMSPGIGQQPPISTGQPRHWTQTPAARGLPVSGGGGLRHY